MPGAQDPITFRELEGRTLTLRFIHVPARGDLETWVVGKNSKNPSVSTKCAGADFSREVRLGQDEQIQLTLRLEKGKSGWTHLVDPGEEREITVDLGGSERRVRLECSEIDLAGHEGSIGLLRVENSEASLGQSIVVLCSEGRGALRCSSPTAAGSTATTTRTRSACGVSSTSRARRSRARNSCCGRTCASRRSRRSKPACVWTRSTA
ncbi:MAG: hypothetical protein IPJ19_20885 [Planctomycetes bacterium]|nr:hypothetical protein [Planctomycetota bacterium]